MKAVFYIVSLLSVIVVNSCTTYYYVVSNFSDDLTVDRSVHVADDDAGSESCMVVDFYETSEKMKLHTSMHGESIDAVSMKNLTAVDPLLCPYESLDRRFRWFYTYYDYRAVFKSIMGMLPLSFDGYMTEDQLKLLLIGSDTPEGWNGVEMYYLLDDIAQRFARWLSDATYFAMCDIFEPFCTKEQIMILDTSKEKFIESTGREALFAMKPDEFDDRLSYVAPGAGFGRIYEQNSEVIDQAYEKKTEIIDCFEASFVFSAEMPGRYIDGNAVSFIGGNPSWKVDAYRLMYDDFVMEATSRKVNIWAFIVTFAAISVMLQIFAKVFSRL